MNPIGDVFVLVDIGKDRLVGIITEAKPFTEQLRCILKPISPKRVSLPHLFPPPPPPHTHTQKRNIRKKKTVSVIVLTRYQTFNDP